MHLLYIGKVFTVTIPVVAVVNSFQGIIRLDWEVKVQIKLHAYQLACVMGNDRGSEIYT